MKSVGLNGIYSGDVCDQVPHGDGTMRYFVGEWKEGNAETQGGVTYTMVNGKMGRGMEEVYLVSQVVMFMREILGMETAMEREH